jgi:GT2 family glycosyltransferase
MMPTAVLDIDLVQVPPKIEIKQHYNRALILIRWRGEPLGQLYLPVIEGQLDCNDLEQALYDAAGGPMRERLLKDFLDLDGSEIPQSSLPMATVAICTRDRVTDLRRCLDAVFCLPDDGQDVLVVDNCPSTDATANLCFGLKRVRYIREDQPGLNVARNRALREARTSIVVFIDDDAVPDSNWLRSHLRHFRDRMVLCTTGLTMPLQLETEAQEWHERYSPFGRGFMRKKFDSKLLSPMASGHAGAGVNMALRREVIELLGPFDEALDAGTRTHSGGDNEMFARVLSAGYQIVYDPGALSWHRHRRTWRELRRVVFGYGVGVYASWISSLLHNREFGAAWVAWSWGKKQIRTLIRSALRRPGSPPLSLILSEIIGCAFGPFAYFLSRYDQNKRRAIR